MKQQFAAKHPWTILAAGAAIQVLTGLPAAWGVFQQPVMEEYGLSEQGAGYAFALLIAAFGVGCVLGGFLQDKKGPRCAALWGTALLCGGFFAAAFLPGWAGWGFFLAFSIPAGLGTAFLYPSIQSCAQKWYAGRKGLATGVIGGAVGLSGAFLTLFVRAALRGFGPVQGIRGAFWALGALTLPVCLAGSAVLSDPPQKKQQPSGKNTIDLSPGQMLRTKQYWLCAGAVCFSTPAVLLFSPIILKLGMERGLDETAALWSIVLGSVGSAAGRMLMPMLSDHIGRRATDLGLFAASLALSAAFWAAQGWWVVVCYAGLTFCYSALAAVLPALSTDLFGLPHAGVNYGFLALGQSVGSLAFPFAADLLALENGRHLQRGERRAHGVPVGGALGQPLGGIPLVGNDDLGLFAVVVFCLERHDNGTLTFAQHIDAYVVRQPVKPHGKPAVAAKIRKRGVRLEKRLLRGVLGVGLVFQYAQRETVYLCLVFRHERLIGALVSGENALDISFFLVFCHAVTSDRAVCRGRSSPRRRAYSSIRSAAYNIPHGTPRADTSKAACALPEWRSSRP